MKISVLVSLLIFAIVASAVISAGLISNNQKAIGPIVTNTSTESALNTGSVITVEEVAKHNTMDDCWMIIGTKVYNLTEYFNLHPGGNATMIPYCGKDGSEAYATKDLASPRDHSDYARQLLDNYFIANLGDKVAARSTNTGAITPPANNVNTNTNNTTINSQVETSQKASVNLTITEVAKHNTANDCWMIIEGRVYDFTAYFDMHPGGNSTLINSCGTDGSSAYQTKGGGGSDHSDYARQLMKNYLLGNLDTAISAKDTISAPSNAIETTNTVVTPIEPETAVTQTISVNLTTTEVAKHSSSNDCWMIIEGNVYDISPYFGLHPGGNGTLSDYCGSDASVAYQTKDKSGAGKDHSVNARKLLETYLLGSLNSSFSVDSNQTSTNTVNTNTNSVSLSIDEMVQKNYPGAIIKESETKKNNTIKVHIIYQGREYEITFDSAGNITKEEDDD